ncbi:MAG: GNAT family N-acetyltransferase [Bacillota bacterium]
MSFSIKRAAAEDAAAISKIHALSWKSAYKGIVPQKYLDGIKTDLWVGTFQKWFAENVFQADILYLDGTAIGCVTYGKSRDERFADWGEIVSIYMHPDHYGKGYGKKLFAHALDQLKSKGYKSCYLWVLAGNAPARRFYERNGFTWAGEEGEIEIGGEKLTDLRYVCSLT